jgi:hypothetical protein
MTRLTVKLFAALTMLSAAGFACAQEKLRFQPGEGVVFTPRHQPAPAGNPAEGHCILKVWVDDRATVMMRGDQIGVRTLSGSPARDEGSFCSGPLPRSVDSFRIEHINAPAGGRVVNLVPPDPRNGYTGSVTIDDPRNGGRSYMLDVWWTEPTYRNEPPARVALNPGYGVTRERVDYFDEERACQEQVRADILSRNRGNIEVEFRPNTRREEMGSGRERIRGGGFAQRRNDSSRFGYECIVDERNDRVVSAKYQIRGSDSANLR